MALARNSSIVGELSFVQPVVAHAGWRSATRFEGQRAPRPQVLPRKSSGCAELRVLPLCRTTLSPHLAFTLCLPTLPRRYLPEPASVFCRFRSDGRLAASPFRSPNSIDVERVYPPSWLKRWIKPSRLYSGNLPLKNNTSCCILNGLASLCMSLRWTRTVLIVAFSLTLASGNKTWSAIPAIATLWWC